MADVLEKLAPLLGYQNGVAERRLSKLINHKNSQILGKGHFGSVLGIEIDGLPPYA